MHGSSIELRTPPRSRREAPTAESSSAAPSTVPWGAPETAFEFGRFGVLPRRRQLLIDGLPAELGTRAFDVLMVLIEADGLLVTKDELLGRVWPGTVVEENNLQVQVSTLRKALGADRDFILTVSGRGCRFTADVNPVLTAPRVTGAPDRLVLRSDLAPTPAVEPTRPTSNLPAPASEFVDRDSELAEILQLITTYRLVTVTGAGGIGKTRLAVEAARHMLADLRDGVWLAELAAVSDSSLVSAAVMSALGLPPGADTMSPECLAAVLRTRHFLLVLDNCEHVIDAAAQCAEWLLRSAPSVHILVTS